MEKSELEKYLRETYAMPEHRDVHDFALEMLKTSRANLEYHQRRTQTLIGAQQLQYHIHEVLRQLAEANAEAIKLSKLTAEITSQK